MNNAIHRRDFLKTAGLATASLSFLTMPVQALSDARSGEFISPDGGVKPPLQTSPSELIKNSPTHPRLLSGCCAYSYRKYLEHGPMTMEDFILKAVELEIDGVDMTAYYLKSTEPSYLVGLRLLAFRNGVPFSGAACATNMCQPDATKRAEEIEKIKKWIDMTELLGASHLRVFGGQIPQGSSDEQGIQWVVETMKPACDYAAPRGITLGIESHGGITSKATNILEILRRVDSPYAGCNLDITHFQEDPYSQIEALVPYATHTHIRDLYGEPKKPLDLERVWKLFVQGGYKGFTSAEYEGEEEPMTGVPKLLATIKSLNKKYSTV